MASEHERALPRPPSECLLHALPHPQVGARRDTAPGTSPDQAWMDVLDFIREGCQLP